MKSRGKEIHSLTWDEQIKKDRIVNISNTIRDWIQVQRQKLTGATLANMVTSGKHLLRFIEDVIADHRPIPSSGLYSLFKEYEQELRNASKVLHQMAKVQYPLRREEACTNTQINISINKERMTAELESLKAVPNHPKFISLCEEVSNINRGDEISDDIYLELLYTLGIMLMVSSGQRPEVLGYISNEDALNLEQNTEDPNLYTMLVDRFNVKKRGKTKTEIRLNTDKATHLLIQKFLMFKEELNVKSDNFLVYKDGRHLNPQDLKRSKTWKKLDIPESVNFRTMRKNAATFYKTNEETSTLPTHVLLNHDKKMSEGPYSTNNQENYNKGAKVLRNLMIPKSSFTPSSSQEAKVEEERKANLIKLKNKLEFKRGISQGRSIVNTRKVSKKGYCLPSEVKNMLLKSIFACKVPSFTYSLLTGNWHIFFYNFFLILSNEQ